MKRLSRTDISIREEAEPCELHERLHCPECERQKEESLKSVLKRSISTNAVNTIKRRTSVTNLHRTLSQTSCYSTGTTKSVPTDLKEESFNEFLDYISGGNKLDKANNLWQILPSETKEVFIKRVMAKKKKMNDKKLAYTDLKILLTAQEYTSETKKRSPYNLTNRQPISQREQLLSEIIGQIFDEVSVQENTKSRYGNDVSPMWLNLNDEEKTPVNNAKSSDQMDLLLENNATMEKIRLWRDRQEINDKINELNRLIDRYEQSSPLATPVSDVDLEKKHTLKTANIPKPKTQPSRYKNTTMYTFPTDKTRKQESNNGSLFDMFASKSKKFIGRFKHKKKASSLDLYRKPNPDARTLINSQKPSR